MVKILPNISNSEPLLKMKINWKKKCVGVKSIRGLCPLNYLMTTSSSVKMSFSFVTLITSCIWSHISILCLPYILYELNERLIQVLSGENSTLNNVNRI